MSIIAKELCCLGSSPQVRGTLDAEHGDHSVHGIIPAGAGHFACEGCCNAEWWDHPRRCGALCLVTTPAPMWSGSSPQVRGTSARVGLITPGRGIIPAGAGHFDWVEAGAGVAGDHPRRCGALGAGVV